MLRVGIIGALAIGGLVYDQIKKAQRAPVYGPFPSSAQDITPEETEALASDLEAEKADLIKSELLTMRWEISVSTKGESVLIQAPNSYEFSHRAYTPSTFPKWFRESGFSASKDFFNCIDKGLGGKRGKRFKRLESVAIERLSHGYKNAHGYNEPHPLFEEVPF